MQITETSLFYKQVISTHVPGTRWTFHKCSLNWMYSFPFPKKKEPPEQQKETRMSSFHDSTPVSNHSHLPSQWWVEKHLEVTKVVYSIVINTIHQSSSLLPSEHMEGLHFLAPGAWMGQGVKGLWPEVMCVTSRPENLTSRVRLSRAFLPSVMVTNGIQEGDAQPASSWCGAYPGQTRRVTWYRQQLPLLLFRSHQEIWSLSVTRYSRSWPSLTDWASAQSTLP